MKTEWDYTTLADAYLKRPDYSNAAIDEMLALCQVPKHGRVCDIGAGVAHLTLKLAERGFIVDAVEPNDAMRSNGKHRTREFTDVTWYEGAAEVTGMKSGIYDLVTFGSSFNVTDRPRALAETKRLLKPGGFFACMWNHRDLKDPLQAAIENHIKANVPDYGYGTRREDQTDAINQSKLFGEVKKIEGGVLHHQSIDDCVEAWRSHATLERQAGPRFHAVVDGIETLVKNEGPTIRIPYTTRIWVAQVI